MAKCGEGGLGHQRETDFLNSLFPPVTVFPTLCGHSYFAEVAHSPNSLMTSPSGFVPGRGKCRYLFVVRYQVTEFSFQVIIAPEASRDCLTTFQKRNEAPRCRKESAVPRESFRFIHTANLALDHQLRGVGFIPESHRDVLERATLIAWERIVAAAIQRNVDFVLLAGNTFDAQDQSLIGQVALVEGLTKLGNHDIPVFIVPGTTDPDMAWRLAIPLPDNVTRYGGELGDPATLSRDGRTFCTIHHVMANLRDLDSTDANGLDELAVFAPQFGPSDIGPFDIALLEGVTNDSALPPELIEGEPVAFADARTSQRPQLVRQPFDPELVTRCPIEYWALGEGHRRRAWRVGRGMAHTPGSPQGLTADHTGSLGCTLIDVESDGRVRESFLPTARVRWENIVLSIAPQASREMVIQQLRSQLEGLPRTSLQELWLVSWRIVGAGRIFDDLHDRDQRERIWAEAARSMNSNEIQLILRQVRYSNPVAEQPGADFLSQEFVRQLQGWNHPHATLAERVLLSSTVADTHWAGRLKPLLMSHDLKDAVPDAQRLGLDWLKDS